jgi:peptidyl-prolyl cis-trans isomerase B (cyclophilin B)
VSPNARDRARAKRRYAKRQANLARKAQARRTRQQVAAAVVGVVIVVGGVFGVSKLTGGSGKNNAKGSTPGSSSSASPSSTPSSSSSAAAGPCPKVTADTIAKPKQYATAPAKTLAAGRTWTATVATTCGTMTFALDGAKAPQTVASFIYLARNHFFDKTTCHRLVTSGIYVLQCGDPTGAGSGGPGYGYGIENAPADGKYPAGTIAMARTSDPKSNGSQFFLVYKESTLPTDGGGYSIFGTVSKGLDVVTKVAAGGVEGGGADGKPATPVNITSVTVK